MSNITAVYSSIWSSSRGVSCVTFSSGICLTLSCSSSSFAFHSCFSMGVANVPTCSSYVSFHASLCRTIIRHQIGLLAETLLEAAVQDNASSSAEVKRLRDETRTAKRKLAQARRERALKAMTIQTASASSFAGTADTTPREVRAGLQGGGFVQQKT